MHVHRSEVGSAEAAQGHRSPWHKQALIWAEQDRTGRSLKHKNYERCSLLQTPHTSPIAVSQSWLTTSTVDFTCIDFMSWSKAKDDLVINLPFLQSRFQGTITLLEMTLKSWVIISHFSSKITQNSPQNYHSRSPVPLHKSHVNLGDHHVPPSITSLLTEGIVLIVHHPPYLCLFSFLATALETVCAKSVTLMLHHLYSWTMKLSYVCSPSLRLHFLLWQVTKLTLKYLGNNLG